MTIKSTHPAIALLVSLAMFCMFLPVAHANPSAVSATVQTATATTTLSYMTAGTATTTLVYDSYAARPTTADSALMLLQFTASSTSTTLNVGYEYSNGGTGLDCLNAPNSCDWYKDNIAQNVNATTSQAFSVNSPNSANWTFASTSQANGAVATTNNRALKALDVPTPVRYVRAIFTITGTNGAVWAQIAPKKENN